MTRPVKITRSEAVVLRELLRDGASDRVIARRLTLSIYTVKSHLKAIYRKAEVADRTQLAVAVLRGTVTPVVKGRPVWHTTERKSA